ncbi:hypothetical protein I5H06_gp25 [Mycobacterium phage SirPhilip]|uniref:Uncharacterized protein n=1 Tax=Mycobacterium phage SirPhilip TaxID=2015824 RepID=A0A222ZLN7_9CAUD|nr:hypothetical protein I5H06_gp25 [Mycobacterium phage SirPhilip]ASR85279.1 hypothetical protein SEA_SIRPHILIP_77 [Mycobacterium phage SirPhilip]
MQNLTAHNLGGVEWRESATRKAMLQNGARYFGVRNAEGLWLSFDGVAPYAVSRKSTAVEVAETIVVDERLHWVRAL